MSDPLPPHELYGSWNSPGQNTGVGSLLDSFLCGIFPTQGLNPGLLLCRHILYQLSYQGSLEDLKLQFQMQVKKYKLDILKNNMCDITE